MDKLPFFYYDILSRITPGAAALATLFVVQDKMPRSWHYFFVDGQQGWKTVIVPLVLGGLAYALGVLFEVIDYCFPFRKTVLKYDTLAFRSAWSNQHLLTARPVLLPEPLPVPPLILKADITKDSDEVAGEMKFDLWEALVFKAGMDPGVEKLFSHCHRYQAEYKMMLHLIYAVVFFLSFSLWENKSGWCIVSSVIATILLFLSSHSRNKRRWLQTITFARALGVFKIDPQASVSPSHEELIMSDHGQDSNPQRQNSKLDQKLKALEAFKDWSNYLLIATVAAVGWIAKDSAAFSTVWLKDICVGLFALSTVYAILTLALIPHIAELVRDDSTSIYKVRWKGWFRGNFELMDFCFPQHIFFLLGIIVYAGGTASKDKFSSLWTCLGILGLALLFLMAGLLVSRRHKLDRDDGEPDVA